MEPRFSVVIPVYKAEKTLRRCVDSLLCQQRGDVEIILVNDGSPDGSGAICEQYVSKYPQVKYFARENGGVSSARNLGLEHASGTYVMFVDSDDYAAENCFSEMDSMVERFDSDLIVFGYSIVNGQQTTAMSRKPVAVEGRTQVLPEIINAMCKKMINSPCAKLYKRSIIEQNAIAFPQNISVGEDRAFNIKYSMCIHSLSVSDRQVYYVCAENTGSLSRQHRSDLDDQTDAQLRYIENAFQELNVPSEERQAYWQAMNFDLLQTVYTKAKYLQRNQPSFRARIRTIRAQCAQINANRFSYPKSRYCRLVSLPVRWRLAGVIDAMAWKLTH